LQQGNSSTKADDKKRPDPLAEVKSKIDDYLAKQVRLAL
jgi:hypothetical protein